jgi:hypothetical protein
MQYGGSVPVDLELYNKIKEDVYSKNPKHSAYRSMQVVKQYKKAGGEYKDDGTERNTTKWLGQKWSSVNDYYHNNEIVKCGNSDTQKKFNEYPLCRPLAIIKKLSKKEMKQLIDNKKDEKPLITKNILGTKKYNIKNTKTGSSMKSVGLKDKYKGQGIPEKVKEEIDENIPIPMGDHDIHKYLPNARIFTYPQLAPYEDIEDLLPTNNTYFIVLYLDSPNTGHWTAVLRYDNKIENFDSYGNAPDTPLKWQSKDRLAGLGQYDEYLKKLYNSTDLKVVYNDIAYQDEKDRSISTCGRHVVNRILRLLKDRYSGCDYARYMRKLKKETELSYDEIVSGLIDS